jgi:hypothetical protein
LDQDLIIYKNQKHKIETSFAVPERLQGGKISMKFKKELPVDRFGKPTQDQEGNFIKYNKNGKPRKMKLVDYNKLLSDIEAQEKRAHREVFMGDWPDEMVYPMRIY